VATIGDINKDNLGQHYPTKPNWKKLPSIPDLVVGCPQSQSSGGAGRLFFVFFNQLGEVEGYTILPSKTDHVTNISLHAYEEFGHSLAPYQDVDKNGIHEIVVGAPSRINPQSSNAPTGAFYIIFPRRRKYHPVPFNWTRFYAIVTIAPGFFLISCCLGTCYFFWYFRRRPDQVEIIVKKSGLQVDPSKPRKKYQRSNVVYIDEYVA